LPNRQVRLAIAGLKKYAERENIKGQTLVAIDSGANITFDRLTLRCRARANGRIP
jgi:threonine dehydratase